MPTELTTLKLTELSLVDRPANPLAMASIFKAQTSKGEDMEDDKIKAEMESLTAEVETLKADNEKLKADNEALRKSVLDEGYKITQDGIEKKAPVEYIEVEGEQINKADVPEVILKSLEKAKEERAESAIAKRCKETLPNIKEENARTLLKAHDAMAEDEAKEFAEFMQSLDALFEGMMEESGEVAAKGDMTDPSEKLNALAKAHQEEHDTTFAKAYAAVSKTDEGKSLVKQIYKKDE